MNTFVMPELIPMGHRNNFVQFENKEHMSKWFTYTTNWPEDNAQHLLWFDLGIYATIEHFNTDESHREPKDRCLNPRYYNKWVTEVVVRKTEGGPCKQIIPWEETLCDSIESAMQTAIKYINLNIEQAREAQIDHMNCFPHLKSLI